MHKSSSQDCAKKPNYCAPDTKRILRRLLTVPSLFVITCLLTATLPLLLIIAFAVDLVRRHSFSTIRTLLCIWLFLFFESSFLLVSGWTWLRHLLLLFKNEELYILANRKIQKNFCNSYVPLVLKIFQAKINIHGKELLESSKPAVMFTRHVSLLDTFLPVFLLFSLSQQKWPRYVLKAELLNDPLFDVVGNRFPNVFIHRGKGIGSSETQRILNLRNSMTNNETLVIYPEGTRFTPKKRKRLIERSLKKGYTDLHNYASSLKATLPPLTKGSMALLSESTKYDLIVMAHKGFENVVTVWDLFKGCMIGKSIDIRITKYSYTDIPKTEEGKKEFLMEIWKTVDSYASTGENSQLTT